MQARPQVHGGAFLHQNSQPAIALWQPQPAAGQPLPRAITNTNGCSSDARLRAAAAFCCAAAGASSAIRSSAQLVFTACMCHYCRAAAGA